MMPTSFGPGCASNNFREGLRLAHGPSRRVTPTRPFSFRTRCWCVLARAIVRLFNRRDVRAITMCARATRRHLCSNELLWPDQVALGCLHAGDIQARRNALE